MTTKFLTTIFSLFLVFALNSCNQPTPPPAAVLNPAESNKKAYQAVLKAFETGNTDSLGNYVTENTVDHGDSIPGITSTGIQRLKDIIALYGTAFSNVKMNAYHVAADGDMLLVHGSWSGNNTGAFMGMPATNKAVSNVEYIDILRFENGKAAEHWEVGDNLSMMTQLGIIPQQGPAPVAVSYPAYDWSAPVTSDSATIAKMKAGYNAVLGMIQSGDLLQLDQYLAPDFNEHVQIPGTTFPAGIEGAKQAMTMFKQAYPDLKVTVEHIAAEGDVLIAHLTVEGTSGQIPGMPPTSVGKKVKYSDVDIIKFNAEGKASDHWAVGDHYTEMVQLGLIPAPGSDAQAKTN